MQEIYKNVRQEIKNIAEVAWDIAIKNNPIEAAKFLDNVTNYYKNFCSEEEIEFLQFYFNMRMEMMKQ